MGILKSEAPMELSEDEVAQRVVDAAEHGYPGDRNAQVRNVANAARGLGIGVTLKALAIITARDPRRALEGQVEWPNK
jgi:hypothetical protein